MAVPLLHLNPVLAMSDAITITQNSSAEDFRAAFNEALGKAARDVTSRETVTVNWIESPVGPLIAGTTPDAVVLLEFSERKILEAQIDALRQRFNASIVPGENFWLQQLRRQLGEYFARRRRNFELPLAYPGTPFQEKVWGMLLQIPYGQTCSYRDLAVRIGDLKATRAVGTANGMNRIAIVIPCHRVINANGKLGGYGGGLWRKQILLDLESGQEGLFGDEEQMK
jgi:AraC family transcriptional regulator, regulatory protein of adaptative response / methylated-DNA-[protein]-cysteine methyltransferase